MTLASERNLAVAVWWMGGGLNMVEVREKERGTSGHGIVLVPWWWQERKRKGRVVVARWGVGGRSLVLAAFWWFTIERETEGFSLIFLPGNVNDCGRR